MLCAAFERLPNLIISGLVSDTWMIDGYIMIVDTAYYLGANRVSGYVAQGGEFAAKVGSL